MRRSYSHLGGEKGLDLHQNGRRQAHGPSKLNSTVFRHVRSGLRSYRPDLGRWINRDPIEELGFGRLHPIASEPRTPSSAPSRFINRILAYGFVYNRPNSAVDPLGLDVYKLRNKSANPCCPDHRTIIGDAGGTNKGSYEIHVAGPDGTSCCGIRKISDVTRHMYQPNPRLSAKEVVEIWRTRRYSIMDVARTSPDVDAELNAAAAALNNTPWDYLLIWWDCGTFANQWLVKAAQMEKERHPPANDDWNTSYSVPGLGI